MEQPPRIVHPDTLPSYSPPGHGGTVNRRLVEASLGAGLEMVLGEVAAGGAARQVCLSCRRAAVVEARFGASGTATPARCRAGA